MARVTFDAISARPWVVLIVLSRSVTFDAISALIGAALGCSESNVQRDLSVIERGPVLFWIVLSRSVTQRDRNVIAWRV